MSVCVCVLFVLRHGCAHKLGCVGCGMRDAGFEDKKEQVRVCVSASAHVR